MDTGNDVDKAQSPGPGSRQNGRTPWDPPPSLWERYRAWRDSGSLAAPIILGVLMGGVITVAYAYFEMALFKPDSIPEWTGTLDLRLSFGLALAVVWPLTIVLGFIPRTNRAMSRAEILCCVLLSLAPQPLSVWLWGDLSILPWGGAGILGGLSLFLGKVLERVWRMEKVLHTRHEIKTAENTWPFTPGNLLRVMALVVLSNAFVIPFLTATGDPYTPLRMKLGLPTSQAPWEWALNFLSLWMIMTLWSPMRRSFEPRRPWLPALIYALVCTLLISLFLLNTREHVSIWVPPLVGLGLGFLLFVGLAGESRNTTRS